MTAKKIRNDANEAKLKGLFKNIKAIDLRLIIHAKNTVFWLTVRGNTVTSTVLAATEFLDFLCARYDVILPKLQENVTAYLCPYTYTTDLSEETGGLVISCHKKVRDKLIYLAQQDFTPTWVRGKILIHQGHIRSEEEARQGRCGLEKRGDVLIRGLWESQTDAIINVRYGDANSDTYKYETMDKLSHFLGV